MSETKTRDEERREPLLGGQQHNSNIEVKKKKKKEEKKKESKPCFSPRGKRTLKLAIGLFGSYYVAASCTCQHPYDWIFKVFTCREGSSSTWLRVDSNGRPLCTDVCSPMTVDLIAGMILTNVFLCIFWYVGEYLIAAFDKELRSELKGGEEWQLDLDEQERNHGLVPATVRRKAPIKHSWKWNEELLGWQERKNKANAEYKHKLWMRAYFFYAFFFCVSWLNQWLVLEIMPVNHSYVSPTFFGFIRQQIKGTVLPQFDGFYAYIIWTQFALEFILFVCSAITVTWPRAAIVRQADMTHQAPVAKVKMPKCEAEVLPQDESMGLIQDTCLLIACHKSTLSKERYDTFCDTLRSALDLFPPNAIFVCDNAPLKHPCDRTQEVCKKVSLERYPSGGEEKQIQYLYIPEGNKSHAMYWTTEHWIPHLVKNGKCPDFQYCMMIDDDVPLPPDLHVPMFTLSRNKDIKAFCYVICAATESGKDDNFLVSLQDLEYKLAGFTKQFQYQYGTTLCCHGAIALWRRDMLGKQILWHHDTEFHGEDQYMGLLLHRMQKNYVIGVSAGAVVPTFAPETLLVLFRQRVTSWDLCAQRKILTQVKMFFTGWCNLRTLILKPYMLQEIINVCLDWVRMYLLVGLAQRNFIGLCLCFIVFYTLLYIEIIIFNYGVLRHREDLQLSKSTILAFPFYRTLCLFFRVYALMRNILMYAPMRPKKLKISYREENQHDLPPVPHVTNPDWATIWLPNNSGDDESVPKISAFTERLMKYVNLEDPIEKRRIRCLIQAAAMIMKLHKENKRAGFKPGGKILDRAKDDMQVVTNAIEEARGTFLRTIRKILSGGRGRRNHTNTSTRSGRIEAKLHEHVNAWDRSGPHMFPVFDDADGLSFERFIVDCNLYVLRQIEQLLYQTKYPATHDRVAVLKKQVLNLISTFEYRRHTERSKEARDTALRSILDDLDEVKRIITERDVTTFMSAATKLQAVQTRSQKLKLSREWRSEIRTIVRNLKAKLRDLMRSHGLAGEEKEENEQEEQHKREEVHEERKKDVIEKKKKQTAVTITCPKGASPGGRLRITTKSGRKEVITIPDGVKPGEKFRVMVG